MERVKTVDIYDKQGNMTGIEAFKENGEFIIVAKWDPTDEQTFPKREQFRKWFYRHLNTKGYEVIK